MVQTPLWSGVEDKRSMMSAGITVSADDIADAMLELLENPQYGDGTILEATAKGTRVVPAFNAPPPDVEDGGISEYEAEVARLWAKKITEEGLKV
jgi:hypothetical protein